jgi:hypothetical protein
MAALRGSEGAKSGSAGFALGSAIGGAVTGLINKKADEEAIDRPAAITRTQGALAVDAASEKAQRERDAAAADINLKQSQADWNNARPDIEAGKRTDAAAKAAQASIFRVLGTLKGQRLDPTDPRIVKLQAAADAAGIPFDVQSFNESKGNLIRYVKTDLAHPEKTITVERNVVTGEETELNQKGFQATRNNEGMTGAEVHADADRDASRTNLERQRSVSNELARAGLGIAQAHLGLDRQRLDLAKAAQDNTFSEQTRKELKDAQALLAESERWQTEANGFAQRVKYKDPNTGEVKESKSYASKRDDAQARAEAARVTARGSDPANFVRLRTPEGGYIVAQRDALVPEAAKSGVSDEILDYTRERAAYYKEQARTATSRDARANARLLADEYAAEADHMESPLHHSQFQPRTEAGQFDGPPRTFMQKASRVAGVASDVINLPKSLKSSLALHGPFRQSALLTFSNPQYLAETIPAQMRAFASEEGFQTFVRSLTEDPHFPYMRDSGLFLPSARDVEFGGNAPAMLREERFSSHLADSIPGLRRVVRPGERAYLAAQDSMRQQSWHTFVRDVFGDPDADLSNADPATLRAIASRVNVFSGRGEFPVLDRYRWGRQFVAALNNPLWSPRAMAARFNALSPYTLLRNAANPATRPLVYSQVKQGVQALTTLGATAGLLSFVPGVEVHVNPSKPGFGTVSIGDTHYDLVDGVPSTAKYTAKMVRAFYLHAAGEPYHKHEEPLEMTKDFFRRRLSPSGAVAVDAATGSKVNGDPFTYSNAARDLAVPFVVDEMWRALQEEGLKGAAKGLPGFIGIPSSTYGKKDGKAGRSDVDVPLDSAAPDPIGHLFDQPQHEGVREFVEGADASAEPTFHLFPASLGSLDVPRASMPQVRSEHRGAMVQFLKGRGISHSREEVAPNMLKPSQAEYSPEKVAKARTFEGPSRAILISADNHVADGHHQWLADLHDAPTKPVPVIRLDAPIQQLLLEMARFPSSGVDEKSAAGASRARPSSASART